MEKYFLANNFSKQEKNVAFEELVKIRNIFPTYIRIIRISEIIIASEVITCLTGTSNKSGILSED